MVRPFKSLLLFFLVLVVCDAVDRWNIDPCPENKVCVIFVGNGIVCTLSNGTSWGKGVRGYIWDAGTFCDRPVYDKLYAELDIDPLCVRKWNFTVTTYKSSDQHIGNIEFDFGRAKISFPNDTTTEFKWKRGDDWHSSYHSLQEINRYEWSPDGFHFVTYSFQIEIVDEKLIDLLGVEKLNWERQKWRVELNDRGFSKRLTDISSQNIKSTTDSQCTGNEPDESTAGMTTSAKMALGFGIGIPVLLLIIAVIGCLVWRNRRANKDSSMKTSYFAFDFSKKQTDIGKSSKRRGQSTNISALRTEKVSANKDPHTPPVGANSTPAVSPGDPAIGTENQRPVDLTYVIA